MSVLEEHPLIEKSIYPPLGDNNPIARLIYGVDVREGLRSLDSGSVHCVVTSPPYWGLRSYLPDGDSGKASEIGAERTPEDFITHLVEVFRELKRVLRTDGTVWLNLGGSYAGGGRAGNNPDYQKRHKSFGKLDYISVQGGVGLPSAIPEGMKAKDMVGEPHRVAFALQADGWFLRAACPWIKRNCLPESCTDRPSSVVEYVFLLAHPESKGRYFYDMHGVRKPMSSASGTRQLRTTDWFFDSLRGILNGEQGLLMGDEGDPLAFVVNPKPYMGAHFACFPESLVEPCIRLGTSAGGVCLECGAPRIRQQKDLSVDWMPTCTCKTLDVRPPVVLDPFSGSATTGLVANRCGCFYIGIDLNASYLALAESRLLYASPPAMHQQDMDEGSALSLFGRDGS